MRRIWGKETEREKKERRREDKTSWGKRQTLKEERERERERERVRELKKKTSIERREIEGAGKRDRH